MSLNINFQLFSPKFPSYMLDWAMKRPLTPVLAASNSEQFFEVVRSDSSFYHIGPKLQPKFPEG